jgi:hypothetical protein
MIGSQEAMGDIEFTNAGELKDISASGVDTQGCYAAHV